MKWFWCDMSDMFGDWVSNEWIAACFGVMAATPQHTHQVLTKRPARMLEWFTWARGLFTMQQRGFASAPNTARALLDAAAEFLGTKNEALNRAWRGFAEVDPWPLPDVWLGVSAEDQQRADERIPILLETPAAVRFVSYEPALGPVDVSEYLDPAAAPCGETEATLDWLIAGAESGPGARPMDEAWVRSVRDQCAAAGVPFFYKQRVEAGRKVSLPVLDGRQHAEWPR
jgi:protein gp37